MTSIKATLLAIIIICGSLIATSQVTSGKIIYERKTNLLKKYSDNEDMKEWIKDKKDKFDRFQLVFNDTACLFMPDDEDDAVQSFDWATSKNTHYQNFKTGERLSGYAIWGELQFVKDSLKYREWKMTNQERHIAGYDCRMAIWYKNDTTRIYAWYSEEIVPSIGPESFTGLPGAILGLATEDGGVVYFAKKVIEEKVNNLHDLVPTPKPKHILKEEEFVAKLKKRFEGNPWGDRLIRDILAW